MDAADVVPEEPPLYEEVKNELDADEVVKAKDLELETGSIFEVEKDFTGLEIPDEKKVKITFHEAKNEEKQDFTTDYEDTYKAVYYVEPVSGHPIYQINRKLIVKEAVVQVAESENQESVSNQEDENEAEGEEPAMQHYLVDYLYDGESGFGGALSTTAKNMLKEIKAALAKMPDPSRVWSI